MATKVLVNGKFTQRAGVYSSVKSGIKNPSTATTYGNVLVIDDGIGAGFGGGSGINGEFNTGINSVYEFESPEAFEAFVKGGELWNLATPLFRPAKRQRGVSKVYLVQAATTTAATITVALTNGSFAIKTKDEGTGANGVVVSGNLTQGIAGKFIKTSNGKFRFQLWHGTYKGLDAVNNRPFDGVAEADAKPQLLLESPEVTAVADLITWFNANTDFKTGFELQAGSTATGDIVDADLVTYPSYITASGGTKVYNAADLDSALAKINNLDFTHIIAMQHNDEAVSTNNDKLFDWIQNTSKYDRYMVVGGGETEAERSVSKATSAYYDSDSVIVVHGGVKKTSKQGFNVFSSLYHACAVLGRCAGLPPQVPVTLKSIDIDGLVDPLEDDDIEDLISYGIMHSYFDTELGGLFVIGLDVTSVQNNEFLIADDGSTYSWQVKRIEADLNKSVILEGKKRFFDPTGFGSNRNTTSPEEVVVWAHNHLQSKTAKDKEDGLIISFKEVQASLNQDNISLTYKFVPNTEVKAIVSTGTMIEG